MGMDGRFRYVRPGGERAWMDRKMWLGAWSDISPEIQATSRTENTGDGGLECAGSAITFSKLQ